MKGFLEQYGVAIFTLVIITILIAFASPIGLIIKKTTNDQIKNIDKIGTEEIAKRDGNESGGAAGGGSDSGETSRPTEPTEAVDQVYCIYYSDGELVISQNQIEPENGRTVENYGFYDKPSDCTTEMITVRFDGAVKPKSCESWFSLCTNLTQIKNIENLYTNECTNMSAMFAYTDGNYITLDLHTFDTSKVEDMSFMFQEMDSIDSLTSINVSNWDTSNVKNMQCMFSGCNALISLDVSKWNTSKVTDMAAMFYECSSLTSIDVSGFDTSKVADMNSMFGECSKLTNVVVSQTVLNKINTLAEQRSETFQYYIGKPESIFNVIKN